MSKTQEVTLWAKNEALDEIREIYAPNLTDTEFMAFVGIGKSTGLNPFLREIWAVKYGNSAASIFVGRDGYRKSAQSNPDYDSHFVDSIYENDSFKVVDGIPEHSYTLKNRGALIGAYALCKRKGSTRPNYNRVDAKEYNTWQSLWKTKPETMIKKVAEAQVLRMTFQEMFAGTYDESEQWEIKETQKKQEEAQRLFERYHEELMLCTTMESLKTVWDEVVKLKTELWATSYNALGSLKDDMKASLNSKEAVEVFADLSVMNSEGSKERY